MPIVSAIPPEEAPISVRSFYQNGDPGPIASTLAHVPELMKAALPFIGKALGPSSIDFRTKEIVILRASALLACRYCVNTHSVVARSAGLSTEEVLALRDTGSPSGAFPSESDQALIAWTDALSLGPVPIPGDLKSRVAAYFDEAEIVELTVLVGATLMLNRYATALELPVSAAHQAFLEQEGLVY